MLTTAHIEALEGAVGRALTPDELTKLNPLVAIRNDVAVSDLLSIGRTRHGPTQIGPGTVLAVMHPNGGEFLDDVEALGAADSNVRWGMDPVRRGALDLQVLEARAMLAGLKEPLPQHAANIEKLLKVGLVPDPLPVEEISRALNAAEGRMTL